MARLDGKHVERILVVKPSSLGDIAHTFPAVELLKRHFPHAKMDWMVHPAFEDAILYSPFPVRRRIRFNREKLGGITTCIPEFFRLVKALRFHHYDLIIDFQGLFRSAFFAWFARGSKVVGFAEPREKSARFFYGKKIPCDMQSNAIARNVELVNKLVGRDDPVPTLDFPHDFRFQRSPLPREFADSKEIVALSPGARWASKKFPEELFAAIVKELRVLRPGIRFIIIGTRDEVKTAHKLRKLCGEKPDVLSFAGHTHIGTMIRVLHDCKLIIGNDSGSGHMGSVLGTPFFALFGSTNPDLTAPLNPRSRVFKLSLPCIGCMKRECPQSKYPKCHKLDAVAIAQAAAELLAESDSHEETP